MDAYEEDGCANIAFIAGAIVGAANAAPDGCCSMIGWGIFCGVAFAFATVVITDALD